MVGRINMRKEGRARAQLVAMIKASCNPLMMIK
jgi:hypothetical protein